MPQLIGLSLTASLYDRTSVRCVALAEALETVSHDRLRRLLRANGSWHTLLELACRMLFVWERGDLIIDDTLIPKPFATAIQGLAWVFSSQERKLVYGLSGPAGMDEWEAPHPSGYTSVAQEVFRNMR